MLQSDVIPWSRSPGEDGLLQQPEHPASIDFSSTQPPPDLTPYIIKIDDHYVAGGAFGDVYKCRYLHGSTSQEVAVKALRFKFTLDEDTKAKSVEMARRELGIWKRLRHNNVVPFLGIAYGFGMGSAMSLVSLWMSNDTLHKFLATHDDKLDTVHRLQILLDIAKGLEYLHSFSIVHGDLNSNNVLLDADYSARLADFGYASCVGNVPEALAYLRRSTDRPGALRWIAPEQINFEETFNRTTKSDVYSLGCVALQVLSGKQPWSEVREDASVVARLLKGCKPCRPESRTIDDLHWDLIQRCWSPLQERPAADIIIPSVQRYLSDYPQSESLRDLFMSSSTRAADPLAASSLSLTAARLPSSPRTTMFALNTPDSNWAQDGPSRPTDFAVSTANSSPLHVEYMMPNRELVLSFDVGMTWSRISYCILEPGEVPMIYHVSRYPGQEYGSDSKIPSILCYDRYNAVRAVGAEALQTHILESAEEENWIKLKWWKHHLRAEHLASSDIKDKDIPPLPQGKSASQVLADFMQYLFICARNYITETHASGTSVWKSVENKVQFVLTHPSGWEGLQQQQIRLAAKIAGLVPEGDERVGRIHLLTEGEARLHFCCNVLALDTLSDLRIVNMEDPGVVGEASEQQGVIIIDARDDAIDLYAYSIKPSSPREPKEIAPPECRPQGYDSVTQRAHTFFKDKLSNSRYGSPDAVQHITKRFDESTKLSFRDANEPQFIWFGSPLDKDPQYDIRSGQLKLAGDVVARFFEPSIEAIVDAFEKQRQAATRFGIQIKCAFLLGDLAVSDFLYCSLQRHPAFSDVKLCRPPSHQDVNKAVVDGGVLSYIDSLRKRRSDV